MTRVVYLHGFASGPGSSKARFFAERFAELGVPVEVPDLAAGDFEHLTISGQLQVIERAGRGQPVILIGSSLGGYLAALYAARHPEVEKMALLAPAFSFLSRWPESLGASAMEEWRRTGYRNVFHYGEGREMRLSYALIEDGRGYEEYPNFQQPAILFHGRDDTVVPPGYSITFSQQHLHTTLCLLDSDHQLLNVTGLMWLRMKEFLLGAAPQ